MKRKHIVFVVGLAIAIGIPVGLLVYKSQRVATLHEYLVERGFGRVECAPSITVGASESTCYAGVLGDSPTRVSFATRIVPGYVPGASQVAADSFVVVSLTLADGTARTWRFQEVWTATDARNRFSSIQAELAKSPL